MLGDGPRAERFLALTGLTPDTLRESLARPESQGAVLGAVMDFLCAHEPDLLGAAESMGLKPQQLAAAAEELER